MPGGEAGAGSRGWRPRWPILLKTGRAAEQSPASSQLQQEPPPIQPRRQWGTKRPTSAESPRSSESTSRAMPCLVLSCPARKPGGAGATPRSAKRGSAASLLRVSGANPKVEGLRVQSEGARLHLGGGLGLLPCSPPFGPIPLNEITGEEMDTRFLH